MEISPVAVVSMRAANKLRSETGKAERKRNTPLRGLASRLGVDPTL